MFRTKLYYAVGLCGIKFATAYPDGVINNKKTLDREQISIERTFFENSQKPFCKKVFCGAFFQKRSAVPTAKLDVCDIKIVTVYPRWHN